jgi:hypothetical protein
LSQLPQSCPSLLVSAATILSLTPCLSCHNPVPPSLSQLLQSCPSILVSTVTILSLTLCPFLPSLSLLLISCLSLSRLALSCPSLIDFLSLVRVSKSPLPQFLSSIVTASLFSLFPLFPDLNFLIFFSTLCLIIGNQIILYLCLTDYKHQLR